MEALFTSTAVVALAEIGDKTQLLAILLATRFKRPLPIILGILVATLANHALAALLGAQAAAFLDSDIFRYVIGASFVAMAAWTLIPDKFEDDDAPKSHAGAFMTTLVAFFLVHIAMVLFAGPVNELRSMLTGWFRLPADKPRAGEDA